jgi:type I restriction enzyme S subunit
MKLETFFEKFGQLADAPNAVTRLRELILESAIRGRLVPHSASDEPSSALLKRLEARDSSRVQAGQLRNQAPFPPVGDDAYLQIPPGWEWTRLGNTGRIFNGVSVSASGKAELAKVEYGLPFIATKDVGYGRDALVYDNGLKVPLGDPRFKVARANAVLICAEGGSAGRKTGIADRDICFGNKLYANEVRDGIHHRYIFYVYQAPTFFREFAARMTGIIGGIARSEFLSLPIPLPPEQEQTRIVAKVDELMTVCDRLEAQQQERKTRHGALARASLSRFADAPTPANLTFVFHKSYDIAPADLRKSILTLAVQGKLVPQDANDEPVEKLIAKVERERRHFADAHKFRTPVGEPLDASSVPFAIPATWKWCRLSSLFNAVADGDHLPPPKSEAGIAFLTIGNITTGTLDFDGSRFVPDSYYQGLADFRRPIRGDILYTVVGATYGRPALVETDRPFCVQRHIAILKPPQSVDVGFLMAVLRSPLAYEQASASTTGTAQPTIPLGSLRTFAAPLPPLAEQRRIVAKVEQLMALVDSLETQIAVSRTTGADLMEAVVAELTARA